MSRRSELLLASLAHSAVPGALLARLTPPNTFAVMLWTRPADVEVWQGDRKLGTSSGPLRLPRGSERVELRLRKDGFTDATVSVVPAGRDGRVRSRSKCPVAFVRSIGNHEAPSVQ